VIFGSWLARRGRPLPLIGSSIGAWRFCAAILGSKAIDRFYQAYLRQSYSENPDRAEITSVAGDIMDELLGADGVHKILDHPLLQLNVMTVRARGLLACEARVVLMPALVTMAALNAVTCQTLKLAFSRHLFHHPKCKPAVATRRGWALESTALGAENLRQALMATAAIPSVIQGVTQISGAPEGTYRDGGVTDYHMPLNFPAHDGIVLFPHFSATFKPGWFDKHLRHRHLHPATLDNVVQIYPSAQFIARLPFGKIPDRRDFHVLDRQQRMRYWSRVHAETERLSDAFSDWLQSESPAAHLQPIRLLNET